VCRIFNFVLLDDAHRSIPAWTLIRGADTAVVIAFQGGKNSTSVKYHSSAIYNERLNSSMFLL
jgi:hypothetical protein